MARTDRTALIAAVTATLLALGPWVAEALSGPDGSGPGRAGRQPPDIQADGQTHPWRDPGSGTFLGEDGQWCRAYTIHRMAAAGGAVHPGGHVACRDRAGTWRGRPEQSADASGQLDPWGQRVAAGDP